MIKQLTNILYAVGLSLALTCTANAADNPKVNIKTNMGNIVIELYPDKAPNTVTNFLAYVEKGAYNKTIFHRVIKGFMIQGGGFDTSFNKKATDAPIDNEANNGLSNERGTISMARTNDPHSATAQFFINVVDNPFLDHTSKSSRGWGYAVFGRVIEGMENADKIRNVSTGTQNGMRDVPKEQVIITSIEKL